MANKKGVDKGYGVFIRLNFILENKGFYLESYIKQFEVSKRTAYRDIEFIRTYKNAVGQNFARFTLGLKGLLTIGCRLIESVLDCVKSVKERGENAQGGIKWEKEI